jgi:hypothetical protein
MSETVSAEIILCRERARIAREQADTASTAEARSKHLAAEARWIALAHSYHLQDRLSKTLGGHARRKATSSTYTFEPEVVAILTSAFHEVFIELGLAERDEITALRVARRIIELVARGERDPKKLKAVVFAWVQDERPPR